AAAAVVPRDDLPAGPGLAGYFVLAAGEPAAAADDLKAALRRRLPEHMVPAWLVPLAELPRTVNGKLDRRALAALPPPGGDRPQLGRAYEAPRTPLEEALAAAWAEVLGVDRVGRQDSFFDLGGDSLSALRAAARLREAAGVELPLAELFTTPTIAILAHRLDGARQESEGPPLVRRTAAARDLPAPASCAQERLWLLARLDPADTAYHVPVAVRLAGRLDRRALAAALATLVARHEALRTVLPERDGRPVQVVRPPAPPPLPRIDLAALPDGRRAAAVEAVLADHARRPFDLARGPLVTARLLALGAEEHVLSLVLHHAVCDEWSLGVLMGELGEAYAAAAAGRAAALPALPIQYADWAAWQRRRLDGPRLEAELEWWRGYLAGATGTLDLPADRPRSPRPARRSRRVPVRLPAATARALLAAARDAGATPFMAAAALLAAQLHRYGGGDDLLLATPVAGRGPAATERLVGFFVNTLPLRLDLAGDPGFAGLLARVRSSSLAAFDHGEVPFEKLVEAAAPARAGAATPLVQAMLAFHNVRLPEMALPGLRIAPVPRPAPGAKLDLLLQLAEDGDELGGVLEVAADLFDAATAERMAAHLEVLAAGLAADPARPVSRAPLLTAGERRQLLAEWRGGAAAAPVARSLADLFAAVAAARPGAVAVSCGEERLTYGELDRRSAALAWEMRRRGVGGEAPVGLLVERSAGLVVAILAALRAGGAYVPLDPEWPSERLAEVAADAGFRVLLADGTTAEEAARLAAGGICVVHIDATAAEPDGRTPRAASTAAPGEGSAGGSRSADRSIPAPSAGAAEDRGSPPPDRADAPLPPVSPDQLAYVIYTSGSTGRPKGVEVTHGNVVRLLAATAAFSFGPDDVWTLFHSAAFDFSVWELWGALAYGGRVVVVPRGTARSPGDFLDLLAAEEVTVLNQTPSAFAALDAEDARRGGRDRLALRWVIFGGEKLEPAALGGWLARRGDRRPTLVNMYGITETTVHVTWRQLTAGDAADAAATGRSPIGVALPDLTAAVVDRDGEAVPVGVPGELLVGGPGVARGYRGRPGLTAERFVPDPFAGPGEAGRRVYRSGDRVRWRASGELDYHG
ncbi:MAG TPA: amino acid adenylation domain-containing protein, partial [Thermoanaerobaculia bacterium]